jgi:hypothetical protein
VRPAFDVELVEEVDVPLEAQQLEDARDVVSGLRVSLARVEAEIAELEALRPRFREPKEGDPPRGAAVPSTVALTDFVAEQLGERFARRRGLEARLDDAEEQVRLREHRLAEAGTARHGERARTSRAAVVTLSAPPSEPVELALEYQVPGARWTPAYELRMDRALSSGALRMRASVAQRTGEDWRDVRLSLSTAALQRSADVPELRALRVGRAQAEPPPAGFREPPPGLDDLFASWDEARAAAPTPPRSGAAPPAARSDAADRRARRVAAARGEVMATPVAARSADHADEHSGDATVRLGIQTAGRHRPSPPTSLALPAQAPLPAAPAPPSATPAAAASKPRPEGDGALRLSPSVPPASRSVGAAASEGARGAWARLGAPVGLGAEGGRLPSATGPAEEETTGVFEPILPEEPPSTPAVERSLDATLLDYDRLTLGGPDAGPYRGRLHPGDGREIVVLAGVSLDVHVIAAVVVRARADALLVSRLAVPAGCHPAGSLESFDYRYDCAGRAEVPSTGGWVSVAVTTCDVGLAPEFVCVPAVDPHVYRTVVVRNTSPHALLAGPCDVSAGDQFLLTAHLPSMPPGGSDQRLGLGVEEAIKVARHARFHETTGGLFGGATLLVHDIDIEVDNRLSAPVTLDVRERVPVVHAGEKDLKVEEGEVRPSWEKVDGPLDGAVVAGARRWRVAAGAGERVTLAAEYTIRIPGDRMLVGGNRRG